MKNTSKKYTFAVVVNYVAVLHVHQEKVDDLDLNAIQHEFVAKNDIRRKSFGNFDFSE